MFELCRIYEKYEGIISSDPSLLSLQTLKSSRVNNDLRHFLFPQKREFSPTRCMGCYCLYKRISRNVEIQDEINQESLLKNEVQDLQEKLASMKTDMNNVKRREKYYKNQVSEARRALADQLIPIETKKSSILLSDENLSDIETVIRFIHEKAENYYAKTEEAEIRELVKETLSAMLRTLDTGKTRKGDMRGMKTVPVSSTLLAHAYHM